MFSALFKKLPRPRRRHRRYPIRRDEAGRSARQRCFLVFEKGMKPDEAALRVNVPKGTARRYYYQWKKLPQNLATTYEVVQGIRKVDPAFPETLINSLAESLGWTEQEVQERLADVERPWGIRRLLTTPWSSELAETPADADVDTYPERRLAAALPFAALLEASHVPTEAIVEALTDNRNRSAADVRSIFTKHHGSLGGPGSVAWIFERRGSITVDGTRFTEDAVMDAAIEGGADDVATDGDTIEVITEPAQLSAVREALESAGIETEQVELTMVPKTTVQLDESDARKTLRLIDALEGSDDVQEVYANFDISDEVLEAVAG